MTNDEGEHIVRVQKKTNKIIDVKPKDDASSKLMTPEEVVDMYEKLPDLKVAGVILFGHKSPT